MTRVKVLREPNSFEFSRGIRTDAFMSFIQWSQGQAALTPALQSINKFMGADAVCLSRQQRTKSIARVVDVIDRNCDPGRPKLRQPFAHAAFGKSTYHLRQGASVLLSDIANYRRLEESLDIWKHRRGIVDIGFICLEAGHGTRDILEFHFTRNSTAVWTAEATRTGAFLADVYKGRRSGLVEKQILQRKGPSRGSEHASPAIMAPNNPACLTRSEWRLCVLIACGLSREGIAQELGVTDNTIRTHLRNVYSKTGITTFHELALKLVGPEEQRNLPDTFSIDAA